MGKAYTTDEVEVVDIAYCPEVSSKPGCEWQEEWLEPGLEQTTNQNSTINTTTTTRHVFVVTATANTITITTCSRTATTTQTTHRAKNRNPSNATMPCRRWQRPPTTTKPRLAATSVTQTLRLPGGTRESPGHSGDVRVNVNMNIRHLP